MKKILTLLAFALTFGWSMLWYAPEATAATPTECTQPISFSLNFEEIKLNENSTVSGVELGGKTEFEYTVIEPPTVVGSGDLLFETEAIQNDSQFIIDHNWDYELKGSFIFKGFVQKDDGVAYVELHTADGQLDLHGTATSFKGSDEELSASHLPIEFGFKASGTSSLLEDADIGNFAFNFEQITLQETTGISAPVFARLCHSMIPGEDPGIGLADHEVTFDDTQGKEKIVFTSSQYTMTCSVPEDYDFEALVEIQAPQKVVSPGALSHFYFIPEIDDECVVLGSIGDILEWMGTSMATPAYR